MKCFGFTFLMLAASSCCCPPFFAASDPTATAAAAPPAGTGAGAGADSTAFTFHSVRGGGGGGLSGDRSESEELEFELDLKGNQTTSDYLRRFLGQYFNPYDDGAGAGCTCSGDAISAIHHAHDNALQKVPLMTLALLQDYVEPDFVLPWQGPFGRRRRLAYNPLERYRELAVAMGKLVMFATDILLKIECNTCGIDGERKKRTKKFGDEGEGEDEEYFYDEDEQGDAQEGDGNGNVDGDPSAQRRPPPRRKPHGANITPYRRTTNAECCCDVEAIRDVTIETMHRMVVAALMYPGLEHYGILRVESLVLAACDTIANLAAPYLYQHGGKCPPITCVYCPCFDTHYLEMKAYEMFEDPTADPCNGSFLGNSFLRSDPLNGGTFDMLACSGPSCESLPIAPPTTPFPLSPEELECLGERTALDITPVMNDNCRRCILELDVPVCLE